MTGISKVLQKANGSTVEVARRVSTDERPCSYQNVQHWVRKGYVPAVWALRVHEEFDIPLHELNPAIYPAPQAA